MISNIDQRILFWDSSESSFTDLTKESNNHLEGSNSLTFQSGDYLYIGTFLPFNHKYFEMAPTNSVVATPTIEMWDGSNWKSVGDILDYTEVNSRTFGTSGIVQFTLSNDSTWSLVDNTIETSALTEFSSGPEIHSKYWSRIGFNEVGVSFGLRYVGNLLAEETAFLAEYPQLSSSTILSSWETGKTDWLDQRILATEYVVTDLKRRNIIIERSQVVETSVLAEACIHKTAEIIYNGLGPRNYAEDITSAVQRYTSSMNLNKFEQDENGNGQKDRYEQNISTYRATR